MLSDEQETEGYELADLKAQVKYLENELDDLQDELNCFWTGNLPENHSLSQAILAQWGRKRIDAMCGVEG